MWNAGWVNESSTAMDLNDRLIAEGRLKAAVENEPHTNDRMNVERGDRPGAVLDQVGAFPSLAGQSLAACRSTFVGSCRQQVVRRTEQRHSPQVAGWGMAS
jgi:hypothetical protein